MSYTPPPARILTVALSGGDYTSIKAAAAAAAVAGDALLIYPGIYNEANPVVLPLGVSIRTTGPFVDTILNCVNPGSHGIVFSGSQTVTGLRVDGASGIGSAGFHFPAGVGDDIALYTCSNTDCDIGILHEGAGAKNLVANNHIFFSGVFTHCLLLTAGCTLSMFGGFTAGGTTATRQYTVDGAGAILNLTGAWADITSTITDGLYILNGGTVFVNGVTWSTATNGVHLGAGGATLLGNGLVTVGSGVWDILVDDAAGVLTLDGSTFNDNKLSVAAGASVSAGFVSSGPRSGSTVYGELWAGTQAESIPLATYTRNTASTAWVSGGLCTINAGFVLDVASGSGFINTGTGVILVTWSAQQVTATADQIFYIYINAAGTAVISATPPSPGTTIILASGRTDATGIRYLARHIVPAQNPLGSRHTWIADTIGSLWVSGLATLELAGPSLQFTVDVGTFYQVDLLVSASASASPCVFNYWYRDGATWDVTVGATALDDANYDPAGAGLVAIPAGTWVKSGLYVNVNNGTTQWHVLYPQASYASQALAEAAPLAVPGGLPAETALPVAAFVFQQGSGDITSILDIRPTLSAIGPGSTAAPAVHAALAGLGADDHGQYLLLSGNAARNPLTGTLDAANGGLILPTGAAPAQTTEGQVIWDSDDDLLTVGDGAARKVMADTSSTQVLGGKTLTTPTIGDFTNATHDHSNAAGGGLVVQATESLRGAAEVATQAETNTGTNDTNFLTPLKLASATSVILNGQAAGGGLGGTFPNPSVTPAAGLDTTAIHSGDAAGGDLTGTLPNPSVVAASLTVAGKIELATQAEVNTGTDALRAVTPLTLASATTVILNGQAAGGGLGGTYPNPSVTPAAGLDTSAIHSGDAAGGGLGGTYPNPSVTPAAGLDTSAIHTGDAAGGDLTGTLPNPSVVAASLTVAGKIELATQAEVNTGTDALRAVTPLTLASATTVILNGQAAGGGLGGTYPNPSVTPAAGLDTTAIHSGDAAGGGLGGTYPNPTVTPAAGLDTTAIHGGDAAGGDLAGTYPNPTVQAASLTVAGKIELATQAEVNTGTDALRAITPLTLASATTVILNGQAAGGGLGGTYPNPSVTPAAGLDTTAIHSGDAAGGDLAGTYPNPTVVVASEGTAGKIEIATQAEVTTGTDDTRAVTPLKLAQALGVSAFTEITVDTTTTASVGTPASLLTINITPKSASSIFLVHFTACGDTNSNSDQEISFSVWYGLTGTQTRRRSTRIFHDAWGNESGACSIVQRFVALGAGQHTIEIRWGVTASTARIRPVANSDYDHAALLVQEVTH